MIKQTLMRYLILTKRLFKKKSFVLILLLVPILACTVSFTLQKGDSGVITVALALDDGEDLRGREIINGLLNDSGLIRFVTCKSPAEAVAAVESGDCDAAWIFPDGLDEKIEKFVSNTHKNNGFVTVIQREENVALRLSHEKLNRALYPHLSLALYGESVSGAPLDEERKEELYFSVNAQGEDLFSFVYLNGDGSGAREGGEDGNFLTSPLRGLLALTVLFGGFAAAMYYLHDGKRGVFHRLTKKERFSFRGVYHLSAVFTVGAAALAAVLITEGFGDTLRELLSMGLYCLGTAGFCMCLGGALRDLRLLGGTAPLVTLASAVLCPVFLSAPKLPALQLLLPTYYYLSSVTDTRYILYSAFYAAAAFLLARFICK